MRKLRVTLLGLMLPALSWSCRESIQKEVSQPNIIFIMSDDHAFKAISAYEGGINNTPNIDRIADEGVLFTHGYVNNSICAPSRAAMLTGKHSFANGKVDNVHPFDWNQNNIAKELQRAGYETALIGKIHLNGLPQGFSYSNVLVGQGQYYNPDFIENGNPKRYHGYCTTITTNIAMDWLKSGRKKDKPFFLMYHQKAPHRSWMPEPKYMGMFDDQHFELPKNFYDNYDGRVAAKHHEMGIYEHMDLAYDLKMLDEKQEIPSHYRKHAQRNYNRMDSTQRAQWDAYYAPLIKEFKEKNLKGKALAEWKYDRYMKDYLSTIQSVDDGVGELLDYLDAEGLAENTIIVYTSDQGFYLGEHGWFDKRFMYEESFRTPILMKYPKEIKSHTIENKLVQNIDFAPTFLDYANIDIPKDMQGESFRSLLNGSDHKWRNSIYYTYYEYPGEHSVERHHGIRTERYKLIHFYYDSDTWEMYDMENDPEEMHNLYGNPSYVRIQENLHMKLDSLREKYGDSDRLDQHYIDRYLSSKQYKRRVKIREKMLTKK
ncbi:sulfatase [Halosquirtibacter xylanolyticus]|uniref:sulfatase family protein n=1 Tax=Halosquirtibacter xylanolyticus TaxID=3374599 RepID=UPI00374894E3|nr:sulfatase [Prolixibacteraceae bacterium]